MSSDCKHPKSSIWDGDVGRFKRTDSPTRNSKTVELELSKVVLLKPNIYPAISIGMDNQQSTAVDNIENSIFFAKKKLGQIIMRTQFENSCDCR